MPTYTYVRKAGDVAFRKVSLFATQVAKFEEFTTPGQIVNYPDVAVVLEVSREDGTTELYYDGPTTEETYVVSNSTDFRMTASIPTARLWVRRQDGTGIHYKVPSDLKKEENGLVSIHIPGGTKGMELFGDKYFEKVINLRMV